MLKNHLDDLVHPEKIFLTYFTFPVTFIIQMNRNTQIRTFVEKSRSERIIWFL